MGRRCRGICFRSISWQWNRARYRGATRSPGVEACFFPTTNFGSGASARLVRRFFAVREHCASFFRALLCLRLTFCNNFVALFKILGFDACTIEFGVAVGEQRSCEKCEKCQRQNGT